jgi:hypothetical protein
VLNEWYLTFESGMAWSRSLERYATMGWVSLVKSLGGSKGLLTFYLIQDCLGKSSIQQEDSLHQHFGLEI